MTPHDVALQMIRQRGTTVSDPEFIAEYLRAELDRDARAFETELQRRLRGISEAFGGMGVAFGALSVAAGYAIRSAMRFEQAAVASRMTSTPDPRWQDAPVTTYQEIR